MASPDADSSVSVARHGGAAEGTCPFAQPPEYFRPPRLGIIHLLAWTATTAVVLKLQVASQHISVRPYLSEAGDVCLHAVHVLESAALGAAIVGAAVLVLRKTRGEAGRFQPGHWFILIQAVMGILLLMDSATWLTLSLVGIKRYSLPSYLLSRALWGAIMLLTAATYLFVARRVWHDQPWRTPAVIAALVHLAIGGSLLWAMVSRTGMKAAGWPIWPLIVCVTFLVAMLRDAAGRTDRDWVHWLGAAMVVIGGVGGATNLATWAVFTFMHPTM